MTAIDPYLEAIRVANEADQKAKRETKGQLVAAVRHSRSIGRTWTEIALVLGVSKQAARERFGKSL